MHQTLSIRNRASHDPNCSIGQLPASQQLSKSFKRIVLDKILEDSLIVGILNSFLRFLVARLCVTKFANFSTQTLTYYTSNWREGSSQIPFWVT